MPACFAASLAVGPMPPLSNGRSSDALLPNIRPRQSWSLSRMAGEIWYSVHLASEKLARTLAACEAIDIWPQVKMPSDRGQILSLSKSFEQRHYGTPVPGRLSGGQLVIPLVSVSSAMTERLSGAQEIMLTKPRPDRRRSSPVAVDRIVRMLFPGPMEPEREM